MTAHKLISKSTAAMVIFLALAAAILSYDVLKDLAASNGVKPILSWLWPLTLDGFLVIASLSVLRNSLLAERTFYPWILVIGFSLASVAFNVVHAPGNLVGQAVAAVPPLALLLSFELLMSQFKSEVKRAGAINSLEQLTAKAATLATRIKELTTEADKKTGQVDQLKEELITLRQEKRGQFGPNRPPIDQANEARQEAIDQRRGQLADILTGQPDLTNGQLADQLGVSVSTIKSDKKDLAGRLIDAANEAGREDIAGIIANVRDGLKRANGQGDSA